MKEEKRRKVIDIAKELLLVYFSDGEVRQPDDMERDIIGVVDLAGCFTEEGPVWLSPANQGKENEN